MRIGKRAGVLSVLSLSLGLAAACSQATAAPGWSSTKTVEVTDPQYGMKAFTLAVQTDNPNLDPNGLVYPVSQSWTELAPR